MHTNSCTGPRLISQFIGYLLSGIVEGENDLEYACSVWHTSLPKFLTDELEHIQKRALKIIVPHLSYSESLIDLKLPTLEERRKLLCRSFYKNNYSDTSVKFFIYCLNLWIISTDLDIPDPSRFLMHELNHRDYKRIEGAL